MSDRADEDLVRASRQGDQTAYTLLVARHYRHVFALCLGMLAEVHDAEDTAQETMLKGLVNIRKLARPEQFESWILRIAKNLCVDLLRRRRRRKNPGATHEPASTPGSAKNHDLEGAIRRLPQELRLPLTMYYFEQQDAGSIARRLGISASLVYERIRAARQELHRLLTEGTTHG